MDKEKEDTSPFSFPWEKCVMGCVAATNKIVTLLPCLHVICSEECGVNFLSQSEPDLGPICKICSSRVTESEVLMGNKIIAKKIFLLKENELDDKQIKLICKHCIFDQPATAYCPDCSYCLCSMCVEIHPTLRLTKDHLLTVDLSVPLNEERKLLEKLKYFCKSHPENKLEYYCASCDIKICNDCQNCHDGDTHKVFNILGGKQELNWKLNVAKNLITKCEGISQKLLDKQEEIKTKGWDNVMAAINEQFNLVINAILKRQRKIELETRLSFAKVLTDLKFGAKRIKQCQSSADILLQTGNRILEECSDESIIHFLNHSKMTVKWMEDFDKNLDNDVEALTHKDWHLLVNPAAGIQAREWLEELAQIQYTHLPNYQFGKEKEIKNGENLIGNEKIIEMAEESIEKVIPNENLDLVSSESQKGKDEEHNFISNGDLLQFTNEMRTKLTDNQPNLVEENEQEICQNDSLQSTKEDSHKNKDVISANNSGNINLKRKRNSSPLGEPLKNRDTIEKSVFPGVNANFLYKKRSLWESKSYPGVVPNNSLEDPPNIDEFFPFWTDAVLKVSNGEDLSEDYCFICLDGGEDLVVCDCCPKVFHFKCHIPPLEGIPEEGWKCNYEKPKAMVEQEIGEFPEVDNWENKVLDWNGNKRGYLMACKFLMECYKIPEMLTMRWKYPQGFKEKYGKVPVHLKYIKERLCFGKPEPFLGIKDFLLAFKEMFQKGLEYYKKEEKDFYENAVSCWTDFIILSTEYYPDFSDLFKDLKN